MLYNVVLVSAVQQCESAIIYTYPLPLEPLSHSTLIRPSRLSQSTSWASYIIQHLLTSCFTYDNAYVSMLHSQFVPPSQLFQIAELFKILKMMPLKCCTHYANKFGKHSSDQGQEKVIFHLNPKERQCQRMFK